MTKTGDRERTGAGNPDGGDTAECLQPSCIECRPGKNISIWRKKETRIYHESD